MINEVPDEFLSLRTRLNARVANPSYQVITDPTSALSQPTVTVSQLLRPLPHFLGVTEALLPLGTSDYNSFQCQLTKRMSNGLSFGASYTLSKMMEATSYLNDNDSEPEQVISNSDRPHRVVLHGLYDLPFGTGKRWLSRKNTVLNGLLGGWQFNWVGTFQSGAPLDVANPGAERVSDSGKDPHTVDQWFDTAQFIPREPFTRRSLPSRLADIRSAGIQKWDFTVSKSFQLSQGASLKIRAELYNAFNRTHFGTPNTVVTNRNFGAITNTFLGPREIQVAARLVF